MDVGPGCIGPGLVCADFQLERVGPALGRIKKEARGAGPGLQYAMCCPYGTGWGERGIKVRDRRRTAHARAVPAC